MKFIPVTPLFVGLITVAACSMYPTHHLDVQQPNIPLSMKHMQSPLASEGIERHLLQQGADLTSEDRPRPCFQL